MVSRHHCQVRVQNWRRARPRPPWQQPISAVGGGEDSFAIGAYTPERVGCGLPSEEGRHSLGEAQVRQLELVCDMERGAHIDNGLQVMIMHVRMRIDNLLSRDRPQQRHTIWDRPMGCENAA